MHVPSWLTSTVVHLMLVLLLGLLTTVNHFRDAPDGVIVSAERGTGAGDGVEELKNEPLEVSPEPGPAAATFASDGQRIAFVRGTRHRYRTDPRRTAGPQIGPEAWRWKHRRTSAIGAGHGGGEGNSLEMRLNGTHRAAQVRGGGGSRESEYAVTQALHWLAEHQNYDGSWSFEHEKSPKCHGACRNPGMAGGRVAPTSLALLPFLGTGQTHREGQYKKTIDLGLRFLVRSMEMQGDIGSLHEMAGQMYGHGLATIVLCEAFGMTRDPFLHDPAQAATNYIVYAQDDVGGGWRDMPHMPGDTSVVGWQVMALKSAQMAYLRVPPNTMRKVGYFLDHVQSDRGAMYGYLGPERARPATTAIGLLCRMYLGWEHDFNPLQRGVQILGQLGPSIDTTSMRNNMYYNYYATQVMHHYGGYPWQRWNAVMRDYLVHSQSKQGHELGSWYFEGSDYGSSPGGRLYCTALSAMTLEVYYRHMPLYRDDSTKGTFTRE